MGDRGTQLPKKQVRQIIIDHEHGDTLGFIAKQNDVHRDTVKKYVKHFEHYKKTNEHLIDSFVSSL